MRLRFWAASPWPRSGGTPKRSSPPYTFCENDAPTGESPSIVEQILKARSYRFLRDSPGLSERAFGVGLETLVKERIRTAP